MTRVGWAGTLVAFWALLLACFACGGPPGAAAAGSPQAPATAQQVEPAASPAWPEPQLRPEHAAAPVPVTENDPQWGNVDAPVTIVELSDFQCPFCARVLPTLDAIEAKYGADVRVVWKHNPLPFHRFARPAHEMAAAVFMLGGSRAFFNFHDLAFQHQQDLSPENLELWASAAGIAQAPLKQLLDSGKPAKKVDEDLELAARIGATGTPNFRINGVVFTGAQPLEAFVAVIDEQLAAARQLLAHGTPARGIYAALTNQNFTLPPARPPEPPKAEDTKVWNIAVLPDDPTRGPRDALVTLVEFSDFQCPFCARVEKTLAELRQLYPKELRTVWKDNPLPFHARAMPSARLGRAVYQTKGNDAFWKLHEALFANQSSLEDGDFEELTKKQGWAWPTLRSAAASPKIEARIGESVEMASAFEARGTPHFFINGRRLAGAQPLENFKALVDEQLALARARVDQQHVPRAKLYAELMKTAENPAPPEIKHADVPATAPTRGVPSAKVVIQEFSDFQCPFCQRVLPTLTALEQEFKGQVRIVWRNLPLPFHAHAQLAAEAAEEVRTQKGDAAFWLYHDLLFAAQSEDDGLDRTHLEAMATKLGIDMPRFTTALDTHLHETKIRADATTAAQIGVDGTPSFLINDYFISGAQPPSAFRRLIKRALAAP